MTGRTLSLILLALPLLACGLQQRSTPAPLPAATETPAMATATSAITPAAPPAGPTGTAGAAALSSNLSPALCTDIPGSRPGESGVAAGNDLHRITLTAENAVCNDGTPAVMYVRLAIAAEQRNTWVFHLQGGGSCRDYEVCLTRWCGNEYYHAGKMSSQWAPPAMRGHGLFSPQPGNPFSGVNQVFVYYCSSDSWTGQAPGVVFADPLDPGRQIQMYTQGHTIVAAVLDALRDGATSDDGQVTMPPLSEATEIIFTGTSAGAVGVTHNLDWVASQFDPAQTRVVGVIDAGVRPLLEDFPPTAVNDSLTAYYQQLTGGRQGINAFLDQSCLALTPAAEAFLCAQNSWIISNHLTTPFFVRMDLGDGNMVRDLVPLGVSL
ncbi:MAG: pectinacetylesterase family protein, partial [Chloroflexi bacterium]|nr:pectinacetylesterase family protein [Chloroflexota bacterium]